MPSKWRILAQKFTPMDQQQPMSVDVDIQFCQCFAKTLSIKCCHGFSSIQTNFKFIMADMSRQFAKLPVMGVLT